MTPCKRVPSPSIAAVLGAALAFAPVTAGASQNTSKRSAELGKRTAKASNDVDKYVSQLDKTEEALTAVSQAQGKDLKKRYESFSKDVKSLEAAQKQVTTDINEMKSKGGEYFASWDQSIAQISDPGLKQSSIERRSVIMKSHDEFAITLDGIGSDLEPFMTNLHDVETFLGSDLSPANVSKASEKIHTSQADGRALKEKIAHAQTQLKQLASEAPK